jgi:hypothetical protein
MKKHKTATIKIPFFTLTSVLLFLLCALIVAYMYFVSMSIVHVVLRQEASHRSAVLVSEIAALESDYIEAQHAISNRLAALEAYYEERPSKIFVARGEPSLVLRTASE